ncbi:hypothetical protein VSR34_23575 [Paraburkholderia sp. JHI2823]|uniref:hypothetical protein n=1 Tax=Paraburkholderia sp. JHI2823 TaxID=3112960 RepID=UPI003175D364
MSIYLHFPGEGSETVYLERWSIRESANGERRFVGYSRETRDGRVSTPVVELDAEARRGRTASGRIYHLVGPSGWSSDGEYVLSCVAEILCEGGAWRDVTEELIPDCRVRNRETDNPAELTLDATARLLFVSPFHVRRLIDEGKLPARTDEEGIQRIPKAVAQAYREKMRKDQREGMERMMDASQRAGLYDAEIEDLPVRRKIDNGNGE